MRLGLYPFLTSGNISLLAVGIFLNSGNSFGLSFIAGRLLLNSGIINILVFNLTRVKVKKKYQYIDLPTAGKNSL